MLFPNTSPPRISSRKVPPPDNSLRIAISGLSGCGNSTVSTLLAEKLHLHLINYTFRDLAQQIHLPMDEIATQARSDNSIDWYLDSTLVERSRAPNIILASRLAVWLLPEANLRVYLQSPLDVRARRIQQREGGLLSDVRHHTELRDTNDTHRYQRLYQVDITDASFVDLMIDAANTSPSEVVEQICARLNPTPTNLRDDTQ